MAGRIREGVTLPLGPLRLRTWRGPRSSRRARSSGIFRQIAARRQAQGPHALCGRRHLAEYPRIIGADPLSIHVLHQYQVGREQAARSPIWWRISRLDAERYPQRVAQPLRYAPLRRARARAAPRQVAVQGHGRFDLWRARGAPLLEARQEQARGRCASLLMLGLLPPLRCARRHEVDSSTGPTSSLPIQV